MKLWANLVGALVLGFIVGVFAGPYLRSRAVVLRVGSRVTFSHGPFTRHYIVKSLTTQEWVGEPGAADVHLVDRTAYLKRITVHGEKI